MVLFTCIRYDLIQTLAYVYIFTPNNVCIKFVVCMFAWYYKRSKYNIVALPQSYSLQGRSQPDIWSANFSVVWTDLNLHSMTKLSGWLRY